MLLVGKVLHAFNDKNCAFGIFVGLSKAFDTIEHKTLLHKLDHYGIRGMALKWFESYLGKRSRKVKIGNTVSDVQHNEYGCPQGSILGPLIYLVMCNSINLVLKYCRCITFADDITLFVINHSNMVIICSD